MSFESGGRYIAPNAVPVAPDTKVAILDGISFIRQKFQNYEQCFRGNSPNMNMFENRIAVN